MNEDLQELAIQYELLRQEINNIDAQIRELQLKHKDLEMTREGIDNLKGKEGSEILVPVGSGLYVKSKLLDSGKCLVNIGAGIVMEKPIEEAVKLIDKQMEMIMNTIVKLNEGADKFVNQMLEIEPKLMGK